MLQITPFRPMPTTPEGESRRARLALAAATIGIAAALLAYAISPGVRHAVRHAAGSVRHAVGGVLHDHDYPAAPPLPSETLIGPRVTLASLRGHRALVSFWASPCARCERQAPALVALARSPTVRGRIVGVDYASDRAAAERFLKRQHWTFPNLRDASGAVGRRYGIHNAHRGLPVTFALDSSGHIVQTLRGPQTTTSLARALHG
jgi:thiol-disulfide isomerase/thioredoxin